MAASVRGYAGQLFQPASAEPASGVLRGNLQPGPPCARISDRGRQGAKLLGRQLCRFSNPVKQGASKPQTTAPTGETPQWPGRFCPFGAGVLGPISRRRGSAIGRATLEVAPPVEEAPRGGGGQFAAGWHVEQGLREEMEDVVTVETGVPGGFMYAAVFDGHEGRAAANFLREELYGECLAAMEGGAALQADDDLATAAAAVRGAFRTADERLLARLEGLTAAEDQKAGSTASVVFVRPDRILVAYAGDSRVVLCRAGEAEDLTHDHRPHGESEMALKEAGRIKAAGGWVSKGRVCGFLAVSRAFGDIEFKTHRTKMLAEGLKKGRWSKRFVQKLKTEEEWVTAQPDMFHAHLGDDAEFVIIASDGLWDALRSSEAVYFVRQQLKKHADVQAACKALVEFAIQERKADDNVSAVLLRLR